jgi:hypothetical protein
LQLNNPTSTKKKIENMTTLHLRKSIGRTALRTGFVLFTLIAALVLVPTIQAVTPAPDGGYPGGNTAAGDDALFSLGSGLSNQYNTAIGYQALYRNAFGVWNTAIGTGALHENSADYNTAVGTNALWNNTDGSVNTAVGTSALYRDTRGIRNTAIGYEALLNHNVTTRVGANTATGAYALRANITGINNTANGDSALTNNKGSQNTGMGAGALYSNTTGSNNTAIGYGAFSNLNGLVTTGSYNIGLGFNAGSQLTNGSNNIDIGAPGVAADSGKIRIGTQGTQNGTFIAGIYNVSEGGTIKPVYINSNGRLGTQPPASSRRFKTKIKPMDKSSEALLGLKPVTFHYKGDEQSTAQFGLIAEEVAKVSPELVVRDDDGEIYTVRYEAVNAMLLNEFLKQHKKVEDLEGIVASLAATVKEQAAQIQKVTTQLEASKPAPQVVLNNQ